MKNRKTPSY